MMRCVRLLKRHKAARVMVRVVMVHKNCISLLHHDYYNYDDFYTYRASTHQTMLLLRQVSALKCAFMWRCYKVYAGLCASCINHTL